MAAPHAHIDDDWSIVSDLNMVLKQKLLPLKGRVSGAGEAAPAPPLFPDDDDDDDDDGPVLHNGFTSRGTGVFRSMEDLVNDFDEKLSVCFRCFVESDNIAAVSVIAEDSLLEEDEIWNALTSNYGRVMPVDWKQSRTCSLHIPTFKLGEKPTKTDVTVEQSDDEELREQLDMHSIIVSFLAEEPLLTAEQVIEEIEEIMQDSPDMEPEHNPSQSDLSMLSLDVQQATSSTSSTSYEKRVRPLNVAELNERLEESETNISRFSEELVQQLALRDELEFEKEVKNSFISALIGVQNRQREHRELLKKKKKKKKKTKLKGGAGQGHTEKTLGSRFGLDGLSSVLQNSLRQTFGSGCSERQYLTTVIPYEKKGRPPSLQDLQILTKILQAMNDDSDTVPGLLTDYILKALV